MICILILTGLESFAQDQPDSTEVRIETLDGNVYNGKILEETDAIIKLATKVGEIEIRKSTITRRQVIDPQNMRLGKYWVKNPQSTRYFWAPNGYGLKKGEAYYQNVLLFFNQVALGVTDRFSIGAGMIPLFLLNGSPTPVWITPKFSVPVVDNSINVGVGGLFGTILGIGTGGSFGLLYGTATFGSRDYNLSLGLGWGYVDDGFADRPSVNIGGMARLGPKMYLLGELYLINDDFGGTLGLTTIGGRSMIKRVGLDYGAFLISEDGFLYGIPWLGISVPLSKN